MLSTSPGEHAFAVTPHNTTQLEHATRGIYIGGTGNLKVTTVGGEEEVFVGIAAGVIHPIAAIIIWSTGTTATSIVGVY